MLSNSINSIRTEDTESGLRYIENISKFLWKHHAGIYRDQNIDNYISSLPANYTVSSSKDTNSEKVIVHIATELYETGGHSNFIKNFLDANTNVKQILILTSQERPVPDMFEEIKDKVSIVKLSGETYESKVKEVIDVLSNVSGFILLSTHPNDVLPDMILRNIDIPVITFNHADHVFWLGASVTDIALNFRSVGEEICKRYRGIDSNRDILLNTQKFSQESDRYKIKENLNLAGYSKICLTICAEYKLTPLPGQNYYNYLSKASSSFPDVCFIVIGPTGEYFDSSLENVRFLGKVSDISDYMLVSDFYLDSFPLSSIMALYEAVSNGLFPILNPYPASKLFVSDFAYPETSFPGIEKVSKNTEEYYLKVLAYMLKNKSEIEERRKSLQDKFNNDHSVENFNKVIDGLLKDADEISHKFNTATGNVDNTNNSLLLNEIVVKDIDEMFTDFLKLSQNISVFKIIFVYLYFSFNRPFIKERNSFKRPTIFFLRRIFKRNG